MEKKVLGNSPVSRRKERFSVSFKKDGKNRVYNFRQRTSKIRKKSFILQTEVQPYTLIFKHDPLMKLMKIDHNI